MKIGIVTDSTCDLPNEILLRYHIASIPLRVILEEKIFRDWRDIQPIELYNKMLAGGAMPQTTPPSITDFCNVYERFLRDYDKLISVHLSSKISDTYERARMAVEELGAADKIIVMDSTHVNAVMAEMVLAIARDIENNVQDLRTILSEVIRIRDTALTLYSPDSLKWLVEGGRLNPVTAMMGGMLNIRPFLSIENGDIVVESRQRRNRTLEVFIDKLEQRFGTQPIRLTLTIAGLQPDIMHNFQRLCDKSQLNISKGRVQMLGAVIGAHLGPGTVGVTAYPESQAILNF